MEKRKIDIADDRAAAKMAAEAKLSQQQTLAFMKSSRSMSNDELEEQGFTDITDTLHAMGPDEVLTHATSQAGHRA